MVKLDWGKVKPEKLCRVINEKITMDNVNKIIKNLMEG
jgi:hypothetical protein